MLGIFFIFMYLFDQIIANYTPTSSGIFYLVILGILLIKFKNKISHKLLIKGRIQVLIGSVFLLLVGLVGAKLSGTPIGLIFFMTLLAFSSIWLLSSNSNFIFELLTPKIALWGLLAILFFLMANKFFGFNLYSYLTGYATNRPSGLFGEPSHLAIYSIPLLAIAWNKNKNRIWVYLIWALLAIEAFSLTLIIMTLLLVFIMLWSKRSVVKFNLKNIKKYLYTISCVFVVFVVFLPFINISGETAYDYAFSRINGLVNNTDELNLSSLVVLQGWDIAKESFFQSYGLGVGIGNFGESYQIIQNNSINRDLILSIMGSVLNLRDGAILFNKIIGELGIFSLVFFWLIVVSLKFLRGLPESNFKLVTVAFITVAFSLIFVRALPYFSAPTLLAFLSIGALVNLQRLISSRKLNH
jgi:hypothetical protein